MRKIAFIILSISILVSCTKFEEGPSISLLSVKNRIVGKWKLDKYLLDGADSTESYLNGYNEEWEFFKNKTLVYTKGQQNPIDGTWELQETNVVVKLQMMNANFEYYEYDTLPLIRLTNREMWARYENGVEKQYIAE
jgi:hypothetical protein